MGMDFGRPVSDRELGLGPAGIPPSMANLLGVVQVVPVGTPAMVHGDLGGPPDAFDDAPGRDTQAGDVFGAVAKATERSRQHAAAVLGGLDIGEQVLLPYVVTDGNTPPPRTP